MQIEILRTGTFRDAGGRDIVIDREALARMASSYDPQLHEAPVVVGHPVHDQPAYGWVKRLEARDDRLLAELGELDPGFVELVRQGRFKTRSVSLYLPGMANHPRSGDGIYLRHVGFLGAQPPAVKGLRPVQLSGDEDVVAEITTDVRERAEPAMEGRAGADASEPTAEVANMTDSAKDAGAAADDLTERQKVLEERERRIAEREAELEAERRRLAREAHIAFADSLLAEGRLVPADRDIVVALLEIADTAPAEFADGDTVFGERLRRWLAGLPKRVEFGERPGREQRADLSDPHSIAERAIAYQAEMKSKGIIVRADEAVRRVVGG